jgi:hypothetical protein
MDRRLRSAQSHDPDRAMRADVRAAVRDLMENIMSKATSGDEPAPTPFVAAALPDDVVGVPALAAPDQARTPRHRRWLLAAAAAAAVAITVGLPAYLLRENPGTDRVTVAPPAATPTGPSPAPASEPSAAPAAGPADRVLLDLAGWTLYSLYDSSGGEDGWSVRYTDGTQAIEIVAYPQEAYEDRAGDLTPTVVPSPSGSVFEVSVLGTTALMWENSLDDLRVAVPPQNGLYLEILGGQDRAEFEALLGHLRWVDTATFAASLPDGFVGPDDELEVAREMLADVPLPPGTTVEQLPRGEFNSRYHFAAGIVGQVVCRWYEIGVAAREAGDTAAAEQAVAALTSSREWTVFQEMRAEGAYPDAVWEVADTAAAGFSADDLDQVTQGLGCS